MIVGATILLLTALSADPQAAQSAAAAADNDKPICRRQAKTGSIMVGKRVCHTRKEWRAIDEANADGVDRFRQRGQPYQRGN